MAESHVVSGLLAKRAELGGMVEHHRKEIDKIETFLTHIDATIRVFAPEIDLRTMKPKAFRERARFSGMEMPPRPCSTSCAKQADRYPAVK